MYCETLERIGKCFQIPGRLQTFKEVHSGNINSTYKVNFSTELITEQSYIIQKINTDVFQSPPDLMYNIEMVTKHLRQKLKTIEYHKTLNGTSFYFDGKHYWRAYDFIPGATYDCCRDLELIHNAGNAYGDLSRTMAEIDPFQLRVILPDFHNIKKRYEMLRFSFEKDSYGRSSVSKDEYDYLLSVMDTACAIMQRPGPLRVVHNDTKISNIIFDGKKPIAVIDFDNVMPGYVWQDFGDAVRSMANSAKEDEENLLNVHFDFDAFCAFASGFLEKATGMLTISEIDVLAVSCFSITCELAVRFLTDFLNGDVYFKTTRERHNLIRCRSQIALATDMWRNIRQMEAVIHNLVNSFGGDNIAAKSAVCGGCNQRADA